jgi:hypothetical protein
MGGACQCGGRRVLGRNAAAGCGWQRPGPPATLGEGKGLAPARPDAGPTRRRPDPAPARPGAAWPPLAATDGGIRGVTRSCRPRSCGCNPPPRLSPPSPRWCTPRHSAAMGGACGGRCSRQWCAQPGRTFCNLQLGAGLTRSRQQGALHWHGGSFTSASRWRAGPGGADLALRRFAVRAACRQDARLTRTPGGSTRRPHGRPLSPMWLADDSRDSPPLLPRTAWTGGKQAYSSSLVTVCRRRPRRTRITRCRCRRRPRQTRTARA